MSLAAGTCALCTRSQHALWQHPGPAMSPAGGSSWGLVMPAQQCVAAALAAPACVWCDTAIWHNPDLTTCVAWLLHGCRRPQGFLSNDKSDAMKHFDAAEAVFKKCKDKVGDAACTRTKYRSRTPWSASWCALHARPAAATLSWRLGGCLKGRGAGRCLQPALGV
jgi:hypothetical protein